MRRLLPILCLAALPVLAQNRPADLQPMPAVPPPPPGITSWDATLEPQVTIKKVDKAKHEEYRINGRLYMVKVTPEGGPPYYLVDQEGNGSLVVQESVTKITRPPMWVLFEF